MNLSSSFDRIDDHLPDRLVKAGWRVISLHRPYLYDEQFPFAVTLALVQSATPRHSHRGFSKRSYEDAARLASIGILIDFFDVDREQAWGHWRAEDEIFP